MGALSNHIPLLDNSAASWRHVGDANTAGAQKARLAVAEAEH